MVEVPTAVLALMDREPADCFFDRLFALRRAAAVAYALAAAARRAAFEFSLHQQYRSPGASRAATATRPPSPARDLPTGPGGTVGWASEPVRGRGRFFGHFHRRIDLRFLALLAPSRHPSLSDLRFQIANPLRLQGHGLQFPCDDLPHHGFGHLLEKPLLCWSRLSISRLHGPSVDRFRGRCSRGAPQNEGQQHDDRDVDRNAQSHADVVSPFGIGQPLFPARRDANARRKKLHVRACGSARHRVRSAVPAAFPASGGREAVGQRIVMRRRRPSPRGPARGGAMTGGGGSSRTR